MLPEKILHLTLKGKWFQMYSDGIKLEEYREIKPYWCARLLLMYGTPCSQHYWLDWLSDETKLQILGDRFITFQPYTHVIFTHGYGKNAPKLKFKITEITIGTARPDWSDNWQGKVFIIKTENNNP